MDNALEAQLEEIKTELLDHALNDENGTFWAHNGDQQSNFDIFNGDAGIALFFLGLYQTKHEERDLDIAISVTNRLLRSKEILEPLFFGFYSGLTGLIYLCVNIYNAGGGDIYLNEALLLAYKNKERIIYGPSKTDLLSGYTGNLFVLTLLYHHSDDETVMTMIKELIERLLLEVRISGEGLKWDYTKAKRAYDSMTGFSHGAAGIAFVLMQLARYFRQDGLMFLAEEAMAYEMQYFSQPVDNWLDLRLGRHRLGLSKEYTWDLEVYLPEMRSINAWAHGAAGIGLARLEAYKLTGKAEYLKQCEAVERRCLIDIRESLREDFTVCSGYSGMLPFLLKYGEAIGFDFLSTGIGVMNRAWALYKRTDSFNNLVPGVSNDFGLFSGKTGVGYALLQLLNPKLENILYPRLPESRNDSKRLNLYSIDYLKRMLFNKFYPETIARIARKGQLTDLVATSNNLNSFETYLKIALRDSDLETQALFDFENAKTTRWKQHKGYLCYARKIQYLNEQAERLLELPYQAFQQIYLILSDHVAFYPLSESYKVAANGPEKQIAVLFISNAEGLQEIYIGLISALIISNIQNTCMTGSLLTEVVLSHFDLNDQEKATIELHVLHQLQLLIRDNIITISNSEP